MPPQAASDAGFAAPGASSGAANKIAFDSIIADGARPVRSRRRRQLSMRRLPAGDVLFETVTSW
jgi:hypothetical protein